MTASEERGVNFATVLPLFVKLKDRRVVVVGGGAVAAAKVMPLVRAGARVTVVAPAIADGIGRAGVAVVRRPFVPRDLDEAWYVVAAAPPAVNREVARAAEVRRIFVNAVDDPENASAYAGAVLQRGGVTVAISTDGAAPALAGLLREGLEMLLPPELDVWVTEARAARGEWRARGIPMPERRPLLLEALNRLYHQPPGGSRTVGARSGGSFLSRVFGALRRLAAERSSRPRDEDVWW